MSYKKILCVGLYDNDVTMLLKLLIKKRHEDFCVSSVGVDEYAHRELRSSKSILEIALELGFIISRHKPIHPTIIREALREQRTVIYHVPRHISKLKNLGIFDQIITPYHHVYRSLHLREDVNKDTLRLICEPHGIPIDQSVAKTYEMLCSWINENF